MGVLFLWPEVLSSKQVLEDFIDQKCWPNQGFQKPKNTLPKAIGLRDEVNGCADKGQKHKGPNATVGYVLSASFFVFAHG